MGAFSWVKFKCVCPNCKEHLEDFQTKRVFGSHPAEPLDAEYFYTQCKGCSQWVEVQLSHDGRVLKEALLKETYRRIHQLMDEKQWEITAKPFGVYAGTEEEPRP
jgi:hypothetical protein